jgi:hypothetical protein
MPASCALYPLEPSSQTSGGFSPAGADARMAPVEERPELGELFGKGVGAEIRRAAQRVRRGLVRARRAADAQVDPARMQRLQHPELLGDDQRRMVGQHHAAGAHAQRRRRLREMTDEYGRRRTGDAGHSVVLGDPQAVVAEAFHDRGEVHGRPQCLRR